MATYLLDWLSLLTRWLHLVAGIAWIGASFYFVWLDNHLEPPADPAGKREGVAGELWAVHGGGFYRARKYRGAPGELPATLHWFYWEAYTTWLSGFGLLCLLYFVRADAYLIDPTVAMLTQPVAIGIVLLFMVASWLVYDGLCRSRLGRHAGALSALIAGFLAGEAWALCRLFSGRGAYIVFGTILGTIMVANVLFVIIPGQRELVRAKQQRRDPDPAAGLRGKQRSVHNTYFTLPVLFVMMSNHYAMTYGARFNWLVLIGMSVAGACIRVWFVARHGAVHGKRTPALPAVLGVLCLAAVVFALAPGSWLGTSSAGRPAGGEPVAGQPGAGQSAAGADPVVVNWIVQQRCVPCHATSPTQPGFSAAPNGVVLQRLDQVLAHLPEVQRQLATRAMPLGNLTGMTDNERSMMLTWIGEGARQ